MTPRRTARLALIPLVALLASCGGGSSGPPPPPRLQSIIVTPSAPSTPNGLQQQFKATGIYSDDTTSNLTTSVTWASGDTAVATIGASSGLAQTLAVGSALITASSGTVSGNTTLNVTAAVRESISITPSAAFSGIGLTTQLTAIATYSDGSRQNVTSTATWTSGTPAVATVGRSTGLVTGVSLGNATVSAAIGSETATATLSVTANMWHPAADMPNSPRCYGTATLLRNGTVFVAGGTSCTSSVVTRYSTNLYDPAANAWGEGGALMTSRAGHTATLLADGRVLVAGGENQTDEVYVPTILSSAEIYDPTTATWSGASTRSVAREGHTATLLPDGSGRVLVVGGSNSTVTATAELYDPATNTWSPAASLASPRTGHTATVLQNGEILVVGGTAGASSLATAELYDPAADTWTATGSMATSRVAFTATLLPGGDKVLVAGGFSTDNPANPLTAAAEIYDSASGTWSPAASLSTPLSDHAATLLPDGKVLVSGGTIPNVGVTSNAELYDPSANSWSPSGSLSNSRSDHSSTLMPNGAVLVAEGVNSGSCELYW